MSTESHTISFASRDEALTRLCQKVFGATPVFADDAPPPATMPPNCRNELRDQGKPHPKSGCDACGDGGLRGCPYETKPTPPAEPTEVEVWVHPDGRIMNRARTEDVVPGFETRLTQDGWTLRLATIHPAES